MKLYEELHEEDFNLIAVSYDYLCFLACNDLLAILSGRSLNTSTGPERVLPETHAKQNLIVYYRKLVS